MTAPICRVGGFDLAFGDIATAHDIEEYRIMSSPGQAPEPNPQNIFPRIEGSDQQYVMVPYSEIAQGLARSRTSVWIPISTVMIWVVLGALAIFVTKSRSEE